MGGVADRIPVDVRRPVGRVGADDVEGGPVAVRADRQHAGRGLHVVAAEHQRGVDAVALEQREQLIAERVGADRGCAADSAPSLARISARAAGGAGGGHPDLLDELAALALGDRSTGRTSTSSTCTPSANGVHLPTASARSAHRSPYPARLAPGRAVASARRPRRRSPAAPPRASVRGTPTRGGAQVDARPPTRAARSRARRQSRSAPQATVPWLASSAALRPSSAVTAAAASSGVPKVAYGRDAHGAAEQQHLVVDDGQLLEHAGDRGRRRRVRVNDGARAVRGARRRRGADRARRSAAARPSAGRRRGRRRPPRPARASPSSAPVGVIATARRRGR